MGDDTNDTVTPDDTGKPVVDEEDNHIGTIAEVYRDTVAINLNPDLTDEVLALFGHEATDEDTAIPKTVLERDPYADLAVFRLNIDAVNK